MKSDPKGIAFSVAVLSFLFCFTKVNRWWLWFIVIAVILDLFGYRTGMIGFIVGVGITKLLKDIFSQR